MRFGNKSVIAEIRDKDKMPYIKMPDGSKKHVKLILNLLAILNRTITAPIFEISMNYIGRKFREKIAEAKSLQEKEELLFGLLTLVDESYCKKEKAVYMKKSKKEKEEYFEDIVNDRIYFRQKPMWEDKPIFYRLMDIYNKYDFLKPDQLYVNKWGREIPIINKQFIGEMYTLKLKQSSKKGFSVRSTGSINSKELPSRSYKVKEHQELASSKAIRFGEFETLNFSIGILPQDIATFHSLYRSSVKGRSALVKNIMNLEDYSIPKSFDNRAAEIFDVILKSLGISVDFIDEDTIMESNDKREFKQHDYNGKTYICTDREFLKIKRVNEIRKEILDKIAVIENSELERMIQEELKNRGYASV